MFALVPCKLSLLLITKGRSIPAEETAASAAVVHRSSQIKDLQDYVDEGRGIVAVR